MPAVVSPSSRSTTTLPSLVRQNSKQRWKRGLYGTSVCAEETGTPAYQEPANTLFRHTTMYRQLGRLIGFAQDVGANASVEWPCPGFGMTAEMEAEESDNG